MPKDEQTRGPRQRPVSCRFCRVRKLRCNRELPCSNCTSRGVTCELDAAVRPSSGTASASTEAKLLERIRKLEELVEAEAITPPRSERNTPSQQMNSSIEAPESETLGNDIAYLESLYSDHELLQHKILSNKVVFKICPIAQITSAPAYINNSTTFFEPLRCIWLPLYAEAQILLEKYVQDFDHVHHIVHTPSLPDMLSRAYTGVNSPGSITKPDGGLIFLFLGIFACATNLWTSLDCKHGLFSSSVESNAQAPVWVKALEDVLDIAHRTIGVSMEGIQGVSIAAFVVLSISGFSRRCKALFNMALLLARDAGLHVLDHPSNANSASLVQSEIGRRLWWYLVAFDWQTTARFDSAVPGVYHCHPRQMAVNKPLNLDDEDLVDGMSREQKPLSWPTMMSYPLQRIRIAEIMRSSIDRNPLFMSHAAGLGHDAVMHIDTEIQLFINDIPSFFQMTTAELEDNYNLSTTRATAIVHQSFCLYSMTWSQRCRLHFPYLRRGFVDPAYAASRDICLHSARQVIKTETLLNSSKAVSATRYKFLGLLVSVFMASVVVLLMDINNNKSLTQRDRLNGEMLHAIRILEQARHESEMAARFLESLIHVVRKHKVCKPTMLDAGTDLIESGGAEVCESTSTQPSLDSLPPITPMSMLGSNDLPDINVVVDKPESGEDDLFAYFNELAQSFEQGIDVASFDWDNILSGLETSII